MILDPLRRWERRLGALPMPSPFVWAALAAAFLGFGVLMGRATGPESVGAFAARRAPLKLLVAAAPASSAPSATSATNAPPLPEAESTPEPSAAPVSSPKEAKHAASGGSSSSSGSSGGAHEPSGSEDASSQTGKAKLPAIKHVFIVMLSDEPYATAFGPASPAHYLTGTLERQGKLLVRYYAVAHEGLADEIALLSGQGPTEATAANCPTYGPVTPASTGPDGQALGNGCVYPATTSTLMGQLAAKHLTWKAYVGGIGAGAGMARACAHPASGLPDPSAAVQAPGQLAPGYLAWRNPFVYFQAIAGSPTCATHEVGIDGLGGDLSDRGHTANLTYIAPGPCEDGSPNPCAPGKTSGMGAADAFLRKVVPKILSSKAYKQDGLLAITVDHAPVDGEYADSSSCCGQPRFPNLPPPTGAAALSPPGGGQVGLLLLSPFVKKGGLVQDAYDHFSLLATVEDLFGLRRLGYAGSSGVKPFSASLFAG